MSRVYTCECGVRTTNPYVIDSKHWCVDCAEDLAPHIVRQRVRDDRQRWSDGSLRSRANGGPGERWSDFRK